MCMTLNMLARSACDGKVVSFLLPSFLSRCSVVLPTDFFYGTQVETMARTSKDGGHAGSRMSAGCG